MSTGDDTVAFVTGIGNCHDVKKCQKNGQEAPIPTDIMHIENFFPPRCSLISVNKVDDEALIRTE